MAQTHQKPHIVCMPFPAQGHITPMLNLAKLLHNKGFHITFVHTQFNYNRLLKSGGPNSLSDYPSFRYETIPDGLPPSGNPDATQDVIQLCVSITKNCSVPFRDLVKKLNNSPDVPRVSCIVSDGIMTFSLDASEEFGIPNVFFWTVNAFSLMCYLHFFPIREVACALRKANGLSDDYLDTVIDFIPGLGRIRIRDTSSLIWTPEMPDSFLQYNLQEIPKTHKASAVILNTFDDLEKEVIISLSSMLIRVYTIGPLRTLSNSGVPENDTISLRSNLWKEDSSCIQWLDTKKPGSVVYVNFGSITVMSPQHLVEFAWGLANSMQNFLWIVRPDLVFGDVAILPHEFKMEIKDRGMLVNWCDQEKVLSHVSVGGFLTHCGWNSTLESLSAGVAMICWPFFADQLTNCHCICKLWGVGVDFDKDVKREGVERVVKELMEGEKGKEIKGRAKEWKNKAKSAISPCEGSSYLNLDKLVDEIILSSMNK